MTLKSTIINLGDYRMDDEDRKLRALFEHAPVPDAGFSARVTRQIKRREAKRRWLLPLALLAGGAFAARPALALIDEFLTQLSALPMDMTVTGSVFPDLTDRVVLGLPLLVVGTLVLRWLED